LTRRGEERGPHVLVRRERGASGGGARAARFAAGRALQELGLARAGIGILLTDDRGIAEAHRDFLGDPSVTDVLSFSAGFAEPGGEGEPPLGDLLISEETARREARSRGVAVRREVGFYVVHGILHLLGLDHETDEGEMRRAEKRLLRRVFG